jgi:hypothetical protein
MPSPIRFRCPGCRARIKAPAQLLGHHRNCPGCGQAFVVRREPPADSSPMLASDDAPRLVWRRRRAGAA